MTVVYEKTKGLTEKQTHYCPGCTHGVIHKLVGEVLVELGILGKTVGVAPVGCSVLAYDYFNCDMHEAAHGRAPAVATGIKRVLPDHAVFTYQGDGDLASIGTAEIVHAAHRGEKFTTIFCKQRNLRNDRRTNGSHNTDWSKGNDISLRKKRCGCRNALKGF